MAISQTVKLVMESGDPIEVTFDARDVRHWEEEQNTSALTNDMSISFLTRLGYLAAKRTKATKLSWDDFDAVCVDVEVVTDRPTERPQKGR